MSVKKVKFNVSTYSDIGDRDNNEDRFTHHIIAAPSANGNDIILAGVFDGHGGSQAAEFVSANIFNPFLEGLPTGGIKYGIGRELEKVFLNTQERMRTVEWPKWQKNNGWEHSTAGTTVAVVIASGDILYAANCGDSPIVAAMCTGNCVKAARLSKDHKPCVAQERLEVEKRGGKIDKGKVGWPKINSRTRKVWHYPFLAMTRALGNFWSLHPETGKYVVSSAPFVQRYRAPSNIRFVIIFSDGIADILSDISVCMKLEKLKRQKERGEGGEESVNYAKEIVLMAKREWAEKHKKADNMTAVVLEIAMLDGVVAELEGDK